MRGSLVLAGSDGKHKIMYSVEPPLWSIVEQWVADLLLAREERVARRGG